MLSAHTKNNNHNYVNTDNKNNNKNHNKFLLCCRPVVMDGLVEPVSEGGGRGRGDRVFKYVKMEHKDAVAFPKVLQALPSSQEPIDRPIKKKSHSSFARVLKAVLFETSLAKKIKKKKRTVKLHQSNGNLLAKVEKNSNPLKGNSINSIPLQFAKKGDGRNIANTQSSRSSSNFSSSRSSLDTNKLFRSNSNGYNQKQDNVQYSGKGCHSSNTGLCLLLVSLLALIFWGKACAIVCTSMWLFVVPRWNSGEISLENGGCYRIIDSDEYKKKIIMEGLLERSRNRGF